MTDRQSPRKPHPILTKLLSEPVLMTALVTVYAYFLGWAHLYTKLTMLGLLHEMPNLSIYEYFATLGPLVSQQVGLSLGGALLMRVIWPSRWYLGVLPALGLDVYILWNVEVVYPMRPPWLWSKPGAIVGMVLGAALLIVACRPRALKWVRAHAEWKWAIPAAVTPLVAFLLYLDSAVVGLGRVYELVYSDSFAVVTTDASELNAELFNKKLRFILHVGDNWYFADITHVSRAGSPGLVSVPGTTNVKLSARYILIPQSAVRQVVFWPDPDAYPSLYPGPVVWPPTLVPIPPQTGPTLPIVTPQSPPSPPSQHPPSLPPPSQTQPSAQEAPKNPK